MPETEAPTAQWRARPVFISSTFRDMHAERDYLRDRVFPELEERLRQRRHYLEPIDLRQCLETASFPEQRARELQVLKVCLDEIERSRPFLIVLLGDRYGWTPPQERVAAAAQEAGFAIEAAGKSVTALEIEFGILRKDPTQRRRSLFFFREPLPYAKMAPEKRAIYSDEYAADPAERAGYARLQALKQRIAADPELGPRVRTYRLEWDAATETVTGLEDWGRQVLEELWRDLAEETGAFVQQKPPTLEAQEREGLAEFVELNLRDFKGRQAVIKQLLALACSPAVEGASWGACVTGEPGAGKSALFARLVRELATASPAAPPVSAHAEPDTRKRSFLSRLLRRPAAADLPRPAAAQPVERTSAPLVLAHAAGSSPRSSQVEPMLRRWVEELAAALGQRSPLAEKAPIEEVEKAFASHLAMVSSRRRVVVLVDALDQFEATPRGRYQTWLPRPWPANARLIAGGLPGPEAEALAGRGGCQRVALPALDEQEAAEIGRAVWQRYHRECNPEVLARVLARRRPEGQPAYANPLWLTLAMEQLNLLDVDDFNRAGQKLHELLLERAAGLPPDVEGLYAETLIRAEKNFGVAWTRALVSAVAGSRAGWREADLQVLIPRVAALLLPDVAPPAWDPLQFAMLRRGLRGQIVQRGSLGRWDFGHLQMRAAVRRRYLGDPMLVRRLHSALADHLLALAPDDPLRDGETMFHLITADDKPRAARFYSGLPTPLGEASEATRTLAGHILANDAEPNPGLDWTEALLDQPGLDPGTIWQLANRLQFDLDDRLANEARLGVRLGLLEATRKALAALGAADPTNAGWQRDLSVSQNKIGEVLLAQGDLAGALAAYPAGLAIRERLAAADPTNAGWQRDLSVSQDNVGEVLRAQGDLAGALAAYRAGLAIRERLAAADPTNAGWQRDLWVSCWSIAVALDRSHDPGAADWWQRAFNTLAHMKQAGLFMSPGDERFYEDLRRRLGR